jgi:DNA repair exonuclease SbcCD ATPase subunit
LHKQISLLLTTDKELKVKKHGDDIERELENVRKTVNKNTQEVERLKQELEKAKQKNKELEQRSKKLNTEKEVTKRGRRGPYSSYSGSVRSGSSRASSFNGSISSKRSGYSYDSYKYRK